jgi:hypothetical protein
VTSVLGGAKLQLVLTATRAPGQAAKLPPPPRQTQRSNLGTSFATKGFRLFKKSETFLFDFLQRAKSKTFMRELEEVKSALKLRGLEYHSAISSRI